MAHQYAEFIYKGKKMPQRKFLYLDLPRKAVVAEIGVFDGENAKVIMENNPPREFYLIDPWWKYANYTEMETADINLNQAREKVYDFFEKKPNVGIIEEFSVEASQTFENHYFDWVFIDGCHKYESIKMDLAYWLPKLKKGGYLCGHDFSGIDQWKWEGVHGAVIEFVIKYIEKKPEVIDELYQTHGKEWYKGITPIKIAEILWECKSFKHFQGNARSFKIQVGEWADDLDYEQVIKESHEH